MSTLDRVIQMEVRNRALFTVYALVINTIKASSLSFELSDIKSDDILHDLLKHLQSQEQFNSISSGANKFAVIEWAKNNLQGHLDWKIESPSIKDAAIGELTQTRNALLADLDELADACKACKKDPCFAWEVKCLTELNYCHDCLGSLSQLECLALAMARDLYELRLNRVPLPDVKLCTMGFEVDPPHVKIFESGNRTYLGVDASTIPDKNRPQAISYAILQFDPHHFTVNDYLVLPYLLLHEYAVHGFSNIITSATSQTRDLRDDSKSLFFEGWMDYVVFQYLIDHLESFFSDSPVSITLDNAIQTVEFSLPQSRRDLLPSVQGQKALDNQDIQKGSKIAKEFLAFLIDDCNIHFPNVKRAKNTFYQMSCDLALDATIDRDLLTYYIGNALSKKPPPALLGEIPYRERMSTNIEESLTCDGSVMVDQFVGRFTNWAEKKFDFFAGRRSISRTAKIE